MRGFVLWAVVTEPEITALDAFKEGSVSWGSDLWEESQCRVGWADTCWGI